LPEAVSLPGSQWMTTFVIQSPKLVAVDARWSRLFNKPRDHREITTDHRKPSSLKRDHVATPFPTPLTRPERGGKGFHEYQALTVVSGPSGSRVLFPLAHPL